MLIKRGILQTFDPTTYTATVLLFEATSYALSGVPMANHMDGTDAIPGALCAVLFFDEHNAQDAVIIAVFGTGTSNFPSPPPGRLTFLPGYRQVNSDVITSGTINTYTLTGGSTGIPAGATGVLYKAYFTSPSAGAFLQLTPHNASDINAYSTLGNLAVANAFLNGCGLLQVDSAGRIDIKAVAGTCTTTLYTHGYTI